MFYLIHFPSQSRLFHRRPSVASLPARCSPLKLWDPQSTRIQNLPLPPLLKISITKPTRTPRLDSFESKADFDFYFNSSIPTDTIIQIIPNTNSTHPLVHSYSNLSSRTLLSPLLPILRTLCCEGPRVDPTFAHYNLSAKLSRAASVFFGRSLKAIKVERSHWSVYKLSNFLYTFTFSTSFFNNGLVSGLLPWV